MTTPGELCKLLLPIQSEPTAMSISVYSQTVPVFVRMLGNLSAILDKTAAHCTERKIDPAVLLGSRLFPDMFALARQVQLATDFAKGCAARMSGTELPKYEDTEATIDELKARIAKTIAFVQSIDAAKFDGADTRTITVPVRGEPTPFIGLVYLNNNVMPNFYFHVTTAYNILRHNGVALGKGDFVGTTK
jgi:hypothetical protein